MSEIKVAMIGLDTTHCEGIVGHLNCPDDDHYIPGCRIVKAFPGGTDLSVSRDRIDGFVETMRDKYELPLVNSLEAAGEGVDAFIVTSVDGRQHREQVEVLAGQGKPIFVDKPFACCVDDADAMIDVCRKNGAALMSCSSLRYARGAAAGKAEPASIRMCEGFGPMSILDDFPPYFWYGIHSAEILYKHMGTGCQSVRAVHEEGVDLMVGHWADGRVGIVKGMRQDGAKPFGRVLYLENGIDYMEATDVGSAAALMLEDVIEMFRTGKEPIDTAETREIVAYLEAAEKSFAGNGEAVVLG